MVKRIIIVISSLIGLLFLVVGVPIVINECYKSGGYITLWYAADVLGYYGIILGAIVSITVLAVTIYYNRRQLVDEAKQQAEIKKWKMIEESANEALDSLHPFILQEIVCQSPDFSSLKLIGTFTMYESNARRTVDKFRFIAGIENDPLITELIEKMQKVSEKCIELQNSFLSFYRDINIEQLGTQLMKNEGSEPELINLYQLSVFQKAQDRSKNLLNELQEVYSQDYGPLIIRKTEIFTDIYRKIAQNGMGGKPNADARMDRKR